jgi:hypothetical protein
MENKGSRKSFLSTNSSKIGTLGTNKQSLISSGDEEVTKEEIILINHQKNKNAMH